MQVGGICVPCLSGGWVSGEATLRGSDGGGERKRNAIWVKGGNKQVYLQV